LPPRPYHIDRKKNKKYRENRRGNWRDYHVKFLLDFLVYINKFLRLQPCKPLYLGEGVDAPWVAETGLGKSLA
jgi:hypothetical protein